MFSLQPAAVSDNKLSARTFWNNRIDWHDYVKPCKTFVRLSRALPLKHIGLYLPQTQRGTVAHEGHPHTHCSPSGSFRGRSARFPSVPIALSPFLPSLPAGLWAEDVSGSVREEGWPWSGHVPSLFFPLVTLSVSADCSIWQHWAGPLGRAVS